MERVCVTSFAQNKIYQHKHDKDIFTKFKCVRVQRIELNKPPIGADPENFSRGSPTFTYNCGSAQIWKIIIFFISSNIGDIKLCKFQGGSGPPDPASRSTHVMQQRFKFSRYYYYFVCLQALCAMVHKHQSMSVHNCS